MTTLTIRKIGNSEGVILPKEILARLHVAEDIMRRYRNTLKKLAE